MTSTSTGLLVESTEKKSEIRICRLGEEKGARVQHRHRRYMSCIVPTVLIGASVCVSHLLAGMYGVSLSLPKEKKRLCWRLKI